MANPAILLAVAVGLLVNAMFIAAMLHCQFDPRVTLFYVSSLLLYTALYLWRRLREQRYGYQHAVLRRGLGYAALGLAAFLSALFFYSFAAPGIPLPMVIAAWLLLAVPAAYCLYRVTVLHLDVDDEEEGVRVRVMQDQVHVGPPAV
jgi:hypothetical protein